MTSDERVDSTATSGIQAQKKPLYLRKLAQTLFAIPSRCDSIPPHSNQSCFFPKLPTINTIQPNLLA
jgi:hypothetical protein